MIVKSLSESRLFRDYAEAFTQASGLPLALREPLESAAQTARHDGSTFCAMMSHHSLCEECGRLQRQVEMQAQWEPCTLPCFAGLCETAIPVRINDQLIGFLETGHIHLSKPSRRSFVTLARSITDVDLALDVKRAEEAWFAQRVLCREKYDAFIKLLAVFARQLEVFGQTLLKQQSAQMPSSPIIDRARKFIAAHLTEDLALGDVARAVNLSAQYFCKQFSECTGMPFLEYLSRVRAEKACELLRNRELRIAEVGYRSGFQSVSQFNRVFRRIVGQSPSDYRVSLKGAAYS